MYEKIIKCAAKTGFEIQSYIPRRGVASISVWGGINFRDLVSMAVISLSHHDISPVLCVRKKDLISNGD